MNTASETQQATDIRVNHMRNVAADFLNRTKALHLERDLVDFLLEIDLRKREEVDALNKTIYALMQNNL